ncbi:Fe-S cluster assembly protein SufD [Hahella ganghwensis]|uniref:Fe-S cluster assembly protein SufD n=1 Tax=Hahella ganghwensis TaxID=286420 RepID=UPI00035E60C5|nr:Fe-S cluster assembly protein SufD [Hahella ganghwensis]
MSTRTNPYQEFHQDCFNAAKAWGDQLPEGLHWLNAERQLGLEQFEQIQLPTRKTENWKYTPIASIVQGNVLQLKSAADSAQVSGIDGDFYTITLLNGELQSTPEIQDPALQLVPFANATADQQNLIKAHLNKTFGIQDHPFAALNASTLQDGVLIHIKADSKPLKPIQIVHANGSQDEGFSSHNRVLIVVEQGAKGTVLETFLDTAGKVQMRNVITEVFLADNSHLTHYALNSESAQHIHTGAVFVEQQAGSQFIEHNYATGSALKRRDIQIKLLGPQADCKLFGAYLIGGQSHVDYHTAIDHVAPHCTSEEVFKGIITDQGKAVFNGRIHIHRDAQQSNANMSNKNLLLTNTAEVNTKPELEIYADDVKCAHGATVGQLDEMSLYYFQTRGISKADANRMLSHAFIETVLNEMDIDTVHAHVQQSAEEFYQHCQDGAK